MKLHYMAIILTSAVLLLGCMAMTTVEPNAERIEYTPTIAEWLDVYLNATCRREYPHGYLRFSVYEKSRLVIMRIHIDDAEDKPFSMPGTVKRDPSIELHTAQLKMLSTRAKEYCKQHGFTVEERVD